MGSVCPFFIFWEGATLKKIAIIMGSDSDLPVIRKAADTLQAFSVPFEMHIYSAHRTPEQARDFARNARSNGFGAIIAAAGMAAHLAGALAANTTLPVIGIPMHSSAFTNGIDALSAATPLQVMDQLNWSNFAQLYTGNIGGVLGETCAFALMLGGIYLFARDVIKPHIPLAYIFSVMFFTWIFGGAQPVLSVFAGGVMLGAIFMATDYVTSPFTNKGKIIYGIGCGLVTSAIRVFGNYAEGVTFAILLMNILVPYINDLTMTKPLGGAVEK